ncbi:MAG: transketolase family protein [Methanomassiliicoccales archaeon]|uniref:transketolase family protein n=1 Tax=Candidatus Methanarcanum hacksteinii TaxID=2911857 RepID=UPI002A7C19D5|nr:transketolase family protein [Candidatus Methanomethylophilaceae archaeon]MCI6025173.1 transketolase family protein [Methanomassiliicoccales archaeon]MDD7479242.1 transketolase family protein [Methanomassiliicoccales archaeon]TQS77917.1 MAG: transketolase [Candidatus Methanarcanum hacksteinii]
MGAAQRNYYGKALARLAKERDDVVVLDADLAGSTKTSEFKKVAPERFVEVGIAEQDMIGVASGLAASGKTVFASTFAVFATGRCWEQIRLAVAYPKQNVKIVSTHCGISVGEDGASHQALEDIAIMRAIPNMVVISPADAHQAYAATMAIAEERGPCYMRLGRADFPLIYPEDVKFEIGKADILREGSDVTLIGTGQMVSYCLDAAKALSEEGISAEVINISTIKPLDADAVIGSVKKTGCAVTAEEHSIIGGLGSAVAEAISESCPVPLVRVGTKDTFGESGKAEMLMEKYGLTAKDIVKAAKDSISKKR